MYTMLSVALCLYQVGNFPGASGFIFSGVCLSSYSAVPLIRTNSKTCSTIIIIIVILEPVRYLGRNAAGKGHGPPKMFLTSVMRGGDLKKKQYEAEGAKEYRESNRRIQKAVKKAKEDWIGAQCEEIETCLNKNNSKRAYQLMKDLTSEKQGRSSTIQDKSGKCLTEEKEILSRWTEYCSELYNYETCGNTTVLDCSQPPEEDLHKSSVIAVASLKKEKSPGVDNIPAELVQAGGETKIDVLTEICNRISRTGEWPTQWTQSLIITLPKKGNLQLCQNYRTINLISH